MKIFRDDCTHWRAKKDVCPSTIEIKLSSQYIFVKMCWILLTSLVRSTCLAPNTINDIREHNVVHYGEVLLLQDYQLDNGSRLEKFRGKEGQTVHRVFHPSKNRSSTFPLNHSSVDSLCHSWKRHPNKKSLH